MQRVAVITGASAGIGREVAKELARRGWRLAIAGRHPERTHEVAAQTGGEAFVADFDRLDEVRSLASQLQQKLPRIDVLINNAGGILGAREESVDGFELTLQRNVLGSVVLTEALLPTLVETTARIVHVSSVMNRIASLRLDDLDHRRRRFQGGWQPYADAKLGVILYARSLAERSGLENFPVHPGYVATGWGPGTRLSQAVLRLTRKLQISAPAGAAPIVHLADTPELGVENGTYFDGLLPQGPTHRLARHPGTIERYWEELRSRVG